ncbi:MAG: alpha/beta fold hydrolase [Myxococcaceae bacterium]
MLSEKNEAPSPARCLVVFLPGVADRASTFREAGFVDELRARRLSVDAVAADATIGYYLRGVEAPVIEHDVVARAVAAGHYEQVWMVGVSMGGFGALHYAASFPTRLDGVLVLAPHLGEESSLQDIRDAGGLREWEPPVQYARGRRDYTADTWRFVRAHTFDHAPGPELYLGYGSYDPVTGQPAMLASVLPASHVYKESGGHSWSTWRRLWARFLDESPFRLRCASSDVLQAQAQTATRLITSP